MDWLGLVWGGRAWGWWGGGKHGVSFRLLLHATQALLLQKGFAVRPGLLLQKGSQEGLG